MEGFIMSNKKTILFIILIVSSLSCKETIVYVPVEPESTIVGTWDWVISRGMFTVTPESQGYTITLRFSQAQDSTYQYFKNDTLRVTHRYKLVQEHIPPFTTDTTTVLVFGDPGRSETKQVVEFRGKDTLQLTDTGLDGSISTYVKCFY